MQITVFDLDHTLLKVNSSFKFGTYLFRQNFMSLNILLKCLMTYFRHKYCQLTVNQLQQTIFTLLFKKRSSLEIQQHADLFLKFQFDSLIRCSALQRLEAARQRGDYLVILSTSPSFLVEPLAKLFKVDEWLATVYTEDNERCLSEISFLCLGEDKARYIKRLSVRLNIPLSSFTMYSDSHLDLPALDIAGKAVAVAPDRKLKKVCKQKEWEILL